MTTIRPIRKVVFVQRLKPAEQTREGIWLPGSWVETTGAGGSTESMMGRELSQLGRIIALSAKAYETGLRKGDIVLVPKFHERSVVLDGERILVLDYNELLLKVEVSNDRNSNSNHASE